MVIEKKNFKTLWRVFSYIENLKPILVFVFLLIVFSPFVKIAGMAFFQIVVDNYVVPLTENYNTTLYNEFLKFILILAFIFVIGFFITIIYTQFIAKIVAIILHRIRFDLFKKMQKLPISYYDTHKRGNIMSIYINDVDTLRKFLNTSISVIIFNIVMSFLNIVMMFYYNWKLTLLLSLIFIGIKVVYTNIIKKSNTYFKEQQEKLGKLNGYIEEMFEGQKVIKVFNREEQAKIDFEKINNSLNKSSIKSSFFGNSISPILGNVSDFNYIIVVCVGLFFVCDDHMKIGVALAFFQCARNFIYPFIEVSHFCETIMNANAGAERIFTLLDEMNEIDDGKITLKNTNGDIKIKNVSFGYGDKDILYNINIKAKRGNKIALIGATGSGKTTIASLLNRFYDVSEGIITIDGIDIKNITKDSLRENITVVLQDTNLFTGSILENVRYGRLNASNIDVIEALKNANAFDFVSKFSNSYNTIITNNGENLSQGEKQLLSIARAMLSKSPILILDEATSSIDTKTEKLIEDSLNKLMKNKTIFIIAHKLSTIKNSDEIIVLDNGKIIEHGKHKELLDMEGKYYQLYNGLLEIS
ncbi:MAG: ABC transporter ATP-binding protein/permease [Rickettsiales bacterium]|jgi:ATP-binding cassette subfamily B protein|nr:ABC transporter ATP-binding protein/permease [Rickettsiales bacterium]